MHFFHCQLLSSHANSTLGWASIIEGILRFIIEQVEGILRFIIEQAFEGGVKDLVEWLLRALDPEMRVFPIIGTVVVIAFATALIVRREKSLELWLGVSLFGLLIALFWGIRGVPILFPIIGTVVVIAFATALIVRREKSLTLWLWL
ncbi:MAG TPA: hypothetical protein VIT23_18860, partial [Terrimicrobiaceae bacterium]